MYDLTTQSILGKFPLSDLTTHVAAFDQMADTFYFGIADPTNTQFAIRVLTQSSAVLAINAHSAAITSFEHASINNLPILFSGAKDGFLKAWKLENNALTCVEQKQMSAAINCLKMISPTVIVAGLANGQVFAWDLASGQCNSIPMSDVEVTVLQIF